MLKRDFKKEIENSLKVIREKVDEGLINKDKKEALELIDRELKAIVGLDMNTIDTLSFDSIMELLSRERQYNSERYVALGEILRLKALLCEESEDSIYYNYKGLLAYNEGLEDDEFLDEEYKEKVNYIINELSKFDLTLEEEESIFKAYEVMKEYDKAEDKLFFMIKKGNKDKDIIYKGIDFYNRLLELEEEELEKGNLPINEVRDSLEEISEMIGEK